MTAYTLENFYEIASTLSRIQLPDDVLHEYDKLMENLNIHTGHSGDNDNKEKRIYKKSKHTRKQDLLTSDKVVEFKERVVVEKDIPEKTMENIRGCLNKLSSKNYTTQKEQLCEYLKELSELNDESYLINCSNYFFEIVGKNKFYSEMYSNLYKEIISAYPIFEERKEQFIVECIDNLDNVEYVDETMDYEKFCKNNKKNDIRRSMNTFMINLYKKDECDMRDIIRIMTMIQERVDNGKQDSEKIHIIEELTENLFIFISQLIKDLRSHKNWNSICNFITDISKSKAKDYEGLTSRIIFKYMDMMDIIKKHT